MKGELAHDRTIAARILKHISEGWLGNEVGVPIRKYAVTAPPDTAHWEKHVVQEGWRRPK